MFCTKCGTPFGENQAFCGNCGNAAQGAASTPVAPSPPSHINGNSHAEPVKQISTQLPFKISPVTICAAVLVVMFFFAPLFEFVDDDWRRRGGSITANGLEFATSSGDLAIAFRHYDPEGIFGLLFVPPFHLILFVFLLVPSALLYFEWRETDDDFLRNISIIGLVAKIIFILSIWMAFDGDFGDELFFTNFTWFALALYVGLVAYTQYRVNQGHNAWHSRKKSYDLAGTAFSQHNPDGWQCKCGTTNPHHLNTCGKCGKYW